ncbi:MCE family protein [Nocardia sp. SYP-A9097]|uniref:MlaD family protein n=1 Tax=Nocardia sp. SYP-A9097 TaxID=2663237 RepID=UPI00129A3358|nr:MlaD family protein [Nocardia sp. SYP-A9097]MRH91295.1 MCE family protein [Nocardia sp. SYP-A9097]
MLRGILGSRAVMSVAVIIVLVLAGAIALTVGKPAPATKTYCADMPDSIGLYQGSSVTVLGIPVGEVTDIRLHGTVSRVWFTVRADRVLPRDVGAVTVSDTLVADRKLALIGPEPSGSAGWNPSDCITKSVTPKSLSETFDALGQLSDQLNSVDDPAQRDSMGSGLAALNNATSGSGDQLNAIIQQLGTALAAPDAAIGHIGALLDAAMELSQRARGGWSQVRETVTGLPQAFSDINRIAFPPIIDLVSALSKVLPELNDVIVMFGSPALRALNSVSNLPQLLASGVGSVAQIIGLAPAIAAGFASAIDPATGKLNITYASPKVALTQPDTAQVCAAVQALTGQECRTSANGAVTVPVLPALLAAVSAR